MILHVFLVTKQSLKVHVSKLGRVRFPGYQTVSPGKSVEDFCSWLLCGLLDDYAEALAEKRQIAYSDYYLLEIGLYISNAPLRRSRARSFIIRAKLRLMARFVWGGTHSDGFYTNAERSR